MPQWHQPSIIRAWEVTVWVLMAVVSIISDSSCVAGASANDTFSRLAAMLRQSEGLISAALYVFSALAMTSATKYAASVWRFPGSSLLLLVECVVTAGGLAMVASPGQYKPFSGQILKHVPVVTMAKAVNMYLSFFAMQRVSLPVYNVLKRLQPVYTMGQDRVIRGVCSTGMEQLSVLLISAGSVVTGLGDLDFDLTGYLIAVIAAGSQSLYLVLARRASDIFGGGLTHVDLVFYVALYNVAIFGPLAATEAGDIAEFLSNPGEPARFAYFLVPYVALGASLNYTQFWCTSASSPLTTAIAGSLKGVLSTVAGVVFFAARLTVVGWIGFALSALGGLAYSEAQKQKNRLRSHRQR